MDAGHLRTWSFDKTGLLMATFPRGEIHEQHDSMPGVSMIAYVGGAASTQGTPMPPQNSFEGDIHAELYRGLWIARCNSCSGTVSVTSVQPLSMCPDCGAGWFRIIFPKNKAEIEAEVMKRPQMRGGFLKFANWNPHGGKTERGKKKGEPNGKAESMTQLRDETKVLNGIAMGLEEVVD